MSDTAQSQAIMFEPTDELELRAARAEPEPGDARGQELASRDARVAEPESGGVGRAEPVSLGDEMIEDASAREQITFEQGYEELKSIVSRLDDPELPVHEMFEGFRRGKGLEKAVGS
jgi:hypothetical protein